MVQLRELLSKLLSGERTEARVSAAVTVAFTHAVHRAFRHMADGISPAEVALALKWVHLLGDCMDAAKTDVPVAAALRHYDRFLTEVEVPGASFKSREEDTDMATTACCPGYRVVTDAGEILRRVERCVAAACGVEGDSDDDDDDIIARVARSSMHSGFLSQLPEWAAAVPDDGSPATPGGIAGPTLLTDGGALPHFQWESQCFAARGFIVRRGRHYAAVVRDDSHTPERWLLWNDAEAVTIGDVADDADTDDIVCEFFDECVLAAFAPRSAASAAVSGKRSRSPVVAFAEEPLHPRRPQPPAPAPTLLPPARPKQSNRRGSSVAPSIDPDSAVDAATDDNGGVASVVDADLSSAALDDDCSDETDDASSAIDVDALSTDVDCSDDDLSGDTDDDDDDTDDDDDRSSTIDVDALNSSALGSDVDGSDTGVDSPDVNSVDDSSTDNGSTEDDVSDGDGSSVVIVGGTHPASAASSAASLLPVATDAADAGAAVVVGDMVVTEETADDSLATGTPALDAAPDVAPHPSVSSQPRSSQPATPGSGVAAVPTMETHSAALEAAMPTRDDFTMEGVHAVGQLATQAPSPPPLPEGEVQEPMLLPSAVALHNAGYPVTPAEFGFEPEVIDEMARALGHPGPLRVLFTLFRLRTGKSVAEAAQRFGITTSPPRDGEAPDDHPLLDVRVLVAPDAAMGDLLAPTLPAGPEPLVSQNAPTAALGTAYDEVRRLLTTVTLGGRRHVAVTMRIDGYVLATGTDYRHGQVDAFKNLPADSKTPPPLSADRPGQFAAPATLHPYNATPWGVAVRMPVAHETQSTADASALWCVVEPAAQDFSDFVGSFSLLRARGDDGVDRESVPGVVRLLALGYNLSRRLDMRPPWLPYGFEQFVSAGDVAVLQRI